MQSERIILSIFLVCIVLCPYSVLSLAQNAQNNLASCSNITDCDPNGDRFTDCIGNKCNCKTLTDTIFIEKTQTCYTQANKSCKTSEPKSPKCVPNSECLNSVCKCKIGLNVNKEGMCYHDYGDSCNSQINLCNPLEFLHCGIFKKCDCSNPTETMFQDSSCRLLVNAQCGSDIESRMCVKNSKCLSNNCTCDPTYQETDQRTCEKVKVGHGESCAPDDCDSSKYLECDASTSQCKCQKPTTGDVFFDENTNTCYLLHNSTCEPETQKCAPNSNCFGKICQCKAGLTPNAESRCFLTHDELCDTDNDLCDSVSFLQCGSNRNCQCTNPDESIYDFINKTCRLLVNSKCDPSRQCVVDAICDDDTGTCVCSDDYEEDTDKTCRTKRLSHGETCESGEEADLCDSDQFLECKAGKCVCKIPDDGKVFYDTNSNLCLLLHNSICDLDGQKCSPNSECLSINGVSRCQCNTNLEPNAEDKCFIAYNNSCKQSKHLCDPLQFLECGSYEKCQCINSLETVYNSILHTCQILANGKCDFKNTTLENYIEKQQNCVQYAECSENNICNCISPFSSNSANYCTLSHGTPCKARSNFCNREKYLECSDHGCDCMNSTYSFYDSKTDYCFLKEGAVCSPGAQMCAPNSKCVHRTGRGNYVCSCDEGLLSNEDGHCFIPYNDTCSSYHDLCDPNGFLHCDLHQKCNCVNSKLSFYSKETKRCQLLAESECSLDSGPQCVENAFCQPTENMGQQKCKCSGDFKTNSDGHCRLFHDAVCDTKNDLCDKNKFLQCVEFGFCDCENSHEMYYDYQTQYCYILAGMKCNSTNQPTNSQKCISNSYCDPLTKRCECSNDNWSVEINGVNHCSIKYGNNCSTNNDLCDSNGFLKCNNETSICACQKQNHTWYDPQDSACKLREGSSCSLNSSKEQECYPNSECRPSGGGGSEEHHLCMCENNFSPNKNGLCHLKYEQECEWDSNDYCDTAAFLSCLYPEKLCWCELSNTAYNPNSQSCERKPGGNCLTSENEPECVENSHCNLRTKVCICNPGFEFSATENKCLLSHGFACLRRENCNEDNMLDCIGNYCVCKSGYFPNKGDSDTFDVQCVPGYLQACNDSLACYPGANLECFPDGYCHCSRPDQDIFDVEQLKCLGIVGSSCPIVKNVIMYANQTSSNCVSNAQCFEVEGIAIGVCLCEEGYQQSVENPQLCESSLAATSFKIVPLWIVLIFGGLFPYYINVNM